MVGGLLHLMEEGPAGIHIGEACCRLESAMSKKIRGLRRRDEIVQVACSTQGGTGFPTHGYYR